MYLLPRPLFKTLASAIFGGSLLVLSACSSVPLEGSAVKYTSNYERVTDTIHDFKVNSVTNAPNQITLMFRLDLAPDKTFKLVSEADQLGTWFTNIQNPSTDNSLSINGADNLGKGSVRTCSFEDDFLYEDIVYYDADKHAYAYAINMDKSNVAFPISDHVGTFTVESDKQGGSLVTWRQYFNKNFHIMSPVLNLMMSKMIMSPAVENLFDQYGGEFVEPNQG